MGHVNIKIFVKYDLMINIEKICFLVKNGFFVNVVSIEFIQENDFRIINNNHSPTHAKKRNGIIVDYNIIDLIIASKSLMNDINGYETNSHSDAILDKEWIDNMSDHFVVKWNINKKINNYDQINVTWRLNSDKWNEYRDLLECLMKEINKDSIERYSVDQLNEYITKSIRLL